VVDTWSDILHSLDSLRDGTTDQTTFALLYQKLTLGRLPLPPEFSIRDAQKILYFLLIHEKDVEKFYFHVHSKELGLGDDLEFLEDVNGRATCGITMDVNTETAQQTKGSTKSNPIISVLSKDDIKDPHLKKSRKKESLSSVVKKISLGKIELHSPDQSEESGNKIPDQSELSTTPTKSQKKSHRANSIISPRSSSVESENPKSRTSSLGAKLKSVSLITSGKKKIRTTSSSELSEIEIPSSGEIPEIPSSETEILDEYKNSAKKKISS